MYKILTFNNISAKGLERLARDKYEVSSETQKPDAIILRSHKLHDYQVPTSLKCIGRAGAGVNNIPVDKMTKKGIVVFNAPGANANAVKELVIASMLLSARNICAAWDYTGKLTQPDETKLAQEVETGKKKFVGFELPGRTLAVIGLGAVGVRVANAAAALGMQVVGYDPVITVENAWRLDSNVKHALTVDEALRQADFVSFHVPLLKETTNMLNANRINAMQDQAVVINLARQGIVDDTAVLKAIETGKIKNYVTDFPSNELKNNPAVIALPHLGASTHQAEENCAVMVAEQIKDFIENGNIKNSVNFPQVKLERSGVQRLAIVNLNRPDMVGQISKVLGASKLNICRMVNESRQNIAYTLLDLEQEIMPAACEQILAIDGVLSLRTI